MLEIRGSSRGAEVLPEPFPSEELFFDERVCQGFFVKPRVPFILYSKNPYRRKEFVKDC